MQSHRKEEQVAEINRTLNESLKKESVKIVGSKVLMLKRSFSAFQNSRYNFFFVETK